MALTPVNAPVMFAPQFKSLPLPTDSFYDRIKNDNNYEYLYDN
jgi:hypothetical protein